MITTLTPAAVSCGPCNARRRRWAGESMPRRARNGFSVTRASRRPVRVAGTGPPCSGSASAGAPFRTALTGSSPSLCRTPCGRCLRPTHGFAANWRKSRLELSGAMPECTAASKLVSCRCCTLSTEDCNLTRTCTRSSRLEIYKHLVIVLLRAALDAGQLKSGMARDEMECLLQREEKRAWRVHVQAFDGKEHFLRYAGRYVRRPPIAQRRILGIADGFVRFWYKDKRRHRRETVRYTVEEFIDRWAQHIPKRYRHAVRHFGLFAPRRWPQTAAAVFILIGTKQRPRPKRRPWAVAIQQSSLAETRSWTT